MRAVLDPSVLVAAVTSPEGASRSLLAEFRAGAFELVTSERLLGEVESLLGRRAIREHVSDADAAALLDILPRESTVVDDANDIAPAASEDPDDDYLIALARASGARVVVSADPHLIRLAGKLPILSPAEFLVFLR